jgi:hypothetical protein
MPLSPSASLADKLDWLDQLRADASVPERVDLDTAVQIHNNICDEDGCTAIVGNNGATTVGRK